MPAGLCRKQLSKASQALVSVVDSRTHTAGADQSLLEDQVNQRVAEQWASEQQDITDRLAMQEGQANPESATGTGAVVHALQQAQVDVLILDDAALSERTLPALDAEPCRLYARRCTAGHGSVAARVVGGGRSGAAGSVGRQRRHRKPGEQQVGSHGKRGRSVRPCPSCPVMTDLCLSSLVRLVQPAQAVAAAAMGAARTPVVRSHERNHVRVPAGRQCTDEFR
jgi:hypothetical protein